MDLLDKFEHIFHSQSNCRQNNHLDILIYKFYLQLKNQHNYLEYNWKRKSVFVGLQNNKAYQGID